MNIQTSEVKPKTKILHRYAGALLFECETPEELGSGLAMRHALEKAVAAKADLSFADLSYANLSYADLMDDKKLVGDRPYMSIGPIGSRDDYLHVWITDKGPMIRAGCFFDTRDQFELQVSETHGANKHAQEYAAALVLADKHIKLWTPRAEVQS